MNVNDGRSARYAVTVNHPGSPSIERLCVTDSWDEAVTVLRSELERTWDDACEAYDGRQERELDPALAEIDAATGGHELSIHLGGYVHELSIVVIEAEGPDELCVCGHLPESHDEPGCPEPCAGCFWDPADPADPEDEDDSDCTGYVPSGVAAAGYR